MWLGQVWEPGSSEWTHVHGGAKVLVAGNTSEVPPFCT